ncbi:MAG: PIN domain-containing protein [Roseivirga sp.]
MDRLFVDTNIVLDLLANRAPFVIDAQELFTLADQQEVQLFVSSLTFANAHYILSQALKMHDARAVLRKLKVLITVLPLGDKVIDLALESDFTDFEDALQYHTALEHKLSMIITRNLKDFKSSAIPVFTAGDYLNLKRS